MQSVTNTLNITYAQAHHHPILPPGWEKGRVLSLLTSIFRDIGLTRTELVVLQRIMKKTKKTDYLDPNRSPVCYEKQADLASSIGLGARQWRRIEKKLEGLGLIARETTGNGRRGCVTAACGRDSRSGLSLEPLIAQIEYLESIGNRQGDVAKAVACTRLEISKARQCLKTCEGDLGDDPLARELCEEREAWSAPSRFKTLEEAETHLEHLEMLKHQALERIRCRSSMSGPAVTGDRCHIQDKIKIEYCSSEKSTKTTDVSETNIPTPKAERKMVADTPQDGDDRGQSLSLAEVVDIASDDMKLYVEAFRSGGSLTLDVIERAVEFMLRELEIPSSVYQKAKRVMSLRLAMLSVVIIDRNRAHPTTPVRKPGAVLNKFIARYEAGALNLWGSVHGIRSRQLKLQQANLAA